MSGFSSIGAALTTTEKHCKKNNHVYCVIDEVEIVENGVTLVETTYECEVCWDKKVDKKEGKIERFSFMDVLKGLFKF